MATTTQATRIGPADHGRRMTLDEFREVEAQEGLLYELAGGVVEVVEVPSDPHGQIEDNLREAIARYRRGRPGLIRRCGGGSSFRLWVPEMASGRNPDLAIVLEGTPGDARGRRPPSWAAEIVSEGAEARERDYVTKAAEYLAFGLLEYWIVDPQLRQVTVLVREAREAGPAWMGRVFRGEDVIESPLLPGIGVVVSSLWEKADLDA